ncbi:MAG: hypothetical protein ISR72_09325 [Methylobacter sp.]|nr:hypothetical protein [Methylobacter sp.]
MFIKLSLKVGISKLELGARHIREGHRRRVYDIHAIYYTLNMSDTAMSINVMRILRNQSTDTAFD